MLMLAALICQLLDEHDHAVVLALVAIAFALLRLGPASRLRREWNAQLERAEQKRRTPQIEPFPWE